MTLDAHLALTAPSARLAPTVPEDAEGDHIVEKSADPVAATHLADGHDVSINLRDRLGS